MFFQTFHQVEFRDTDAAGIAHFSVFLNWMERTEHRMLRHFGWSVVHSQDGKTISWPRVNTSCNFRQPLKFEQTFGVELSVEKLGRSSATYQFRFLNDPTVVQLEAHSPQAQQLLTHGQVTESSWFEQVEPSATGTITAVCCHVQHGQRPSPIEIPLSLRQHLEGFQTGS